MATQRQILANRANAARSTGPVTAEGKKIASRNSTRHGMLAQTVVLDGESKSRFEELLNQFIALLNPQSAAEAAIVETMTIARWKQMRIWGIEKAGFQLEMARESSAAGANATRGYLTFKRLADNSRVLDLQHRYETGYERQFCRAYSFLLKLRARSGTQSPETQLPDTPFLLMPLVCATPTWESPSEAPADGNASLLEPEFSPESNPEPNKNDEAGTNNSRNHAAASGEQQRSSADSNPVNLSKPAPEATRPSMGRLVKAPEAKDPAPSQPVLPHEANSSASKTLTPALGKRNPSRFSG